MRLRLGVTLVELLVALVVLGLLTGIAVMQVRPVAAPSVDWLSDSVAVLRARAIDLGIPQTAVFTGDSSNAHAITALPDGRMIADSALRMDTFTGQRREAR